jgi:hypothetical protein
LFTPVVIGDPVPYGADSPEARAFADENLHCAAGEAHLDLAAREAVGNAVEVVLDIDVVIDADPAHAPFGEDIRLAR